MQAQSALFFRLQPRPFAPSPNALRRYGAGLFSSPAGLSKAARSLVQVACCLSVILVLGCAGESPADFQAEGRKLMQEGNANGAVVFFKNALEKEPTNFSIRLDLAKAYIALGKRDQAENELTKCLVQNADDPEANLAYGTLLVETHRPDQALKHITIAEKGAPATSRSREYAARAYALLGQPDKAVEALTESLTLEPGRQSSLLMLARARLAQNDLAAARTLADEMLAKDRDSVDVWRLQADIAMVSQDIPKAIESYQQIVRLKPLDDTAWYMWGMLLLRQGQTAEAATVLKKMTGTMQASPQMDMLKGLLAFEEGDFTAAATAFQKSLDQRPSLEGYYRLALSQERLGNLESAISSLTRILDTLPDHQPSLQLMANILLRQHRLEDAQQTAEKLTTLAPGNPVGHQLLGSILNARGKSREALASFKKALEIDPKLSAASMARTSIFLAERAFPEAVKELEQAIDANRANVEARTALFNFYVGRGDMAAAAKVVQEGLEELPDNPTLLTMQATLLAGQRKETEALALLEKARTLDPDLLPAFNLELRLHRMAGRKEAALALCDAYLQRHPDATTQLITSAVLLDSLDRRDEATTRLEKAADLGEPRALGILVQRDAATGKVEQAEQRLVKAMEANPSSTLRAQLGQFYLLHDQFDKAWALYTALEKERPAEADHGKFMLLTAAHRYEEALKLAQTMVTRDPGNLLGHVAVADALEKLGRRDEALDTLEKTYRDSQNPALLTAMADLCRRMGNQQKAEDFYRTALVQNPDNLQALMGQGTIFLKTGRAEQAVELYERALARQPSNVAVLNNLAMAYADSGKDFDRALLMAMRAYLLRPEDPNVIDTLGLCLMKSGRAEEAGALLRDAVAAHPDSAMLYERLAQVLRGLGKKDEAEQAARKARDLNTPAS